jgi:hypothetical protein
MTLFSKIPSTQELIMTSPLQAFILCAALAAQAALADDQLPVPPASAQGPSQQAAADARAACGPDIQKLCTGVQPGGGRILACLKQHKDQVSDGCKQAVAKATRGAN